MGQGTALLGKAEKVMVGLLGLGLLGILYLVIFGNLSGNLGWTQDSVIVVNESGLSINTTAGSTLTGASDTGATSFVITAVWGNATINVTTTYLIPAANYSVSAAGVLTNNSIIPDPIGYGDVNSSYTYTRDSQPDINSEQTIGNLTGGVVTFFSFSGTLFTLTAITLLIGIILVVIGLVRGGRGSGRNNDSERLTN